MKKEENNLNLTFLEKSLGIRKVIGSKQYKTDRKYKSKNVEILRFDKNKAIVVHGLTDENEHALEILNK